MEKRSGEENGINRFKIQFVRRWGQHIKIGLDREEWYQGATWLKEGRKK